MSRLIIIYSHVKWEITSRRPLYRALAREMKGEAIIFLVNRPLWLPLEFLRNPGKLLSWFKGGRVPHEIEENLYLYTPWIVLHDQLALGHNHIIRFNNYILRRQIEKALIKIGAKSFRRIIWISHPLQYDWLKLIKGDIAIYECFDEYTAYPGYSEIYKKKISRYEDNVLNEVDMTFVVSQELLKKKSKKSKNCYLIPNAVELEHFKKATLKETIIPADISVIKTPIIGFIGGIWGIFDISLIKYIASSCPEWSIVLVGNLTTVGTKYFYNEFKELTELKNVFWLGWKKYEVLPNYLKAMNVCLLPYVIEEWTTNCYPSKVHQYLAADKPIVSTDLPEIRPFNDIVKIAKTHKEFLAKISEFLAEDDPQMTIKRITVATKNTWDARARRIAEIIKEKIV